MTAENCAKLLVLSVFMPTVAFASTTPRPDPSDPTANVPAVSIPSVFSGYLPYKEQKIGPWTELNNSVAQTPGMNGMSDGDASTMPSKDAASPDAKGHNAMPGMTHGMKRGEMHK